MRFKFGFGLAAIAVIGLAVGLFVIPAHAAPPPILVDGRAAFYGYFQNNVDTGGEKVWLDGVHSTDINTFVALVRTRVAGGPGITSQQQVGAEFIIQTMRGGTVHAAATPAEIDDWEARVRYASAQGWIDWNPPVNGVLKNNFSYSINSYYQFPRTTADPRDYAGLYNDDAFFSESDTVPAIVFRNGGTFYYALKQLCANPLGSLPGLPGLPKVPAFNLTATLTGPTATNLSGVKYLEPGKTYTFDPGASNASSNASGQYTLSINNPSAANFTMGPPATLKWDESALGASGVRVRSIPVTVSAGAANGAGPFCFHSHVTPSDLAGGSVDSPSLCYMIYKVLKPVVIGQGSDVHAGSGLCGPSYTTPGSGYVNGQGDSKGEYVVSAGGLSTPFGSNGSSTSPTTSITDYLSLTLCRPNLVNVASAFVSLHPAEVTKPGGGSPYTLTLDALNALDLLYNNGVIYIPGDLVISPGGTEVVARKLTIYATGNITINSNIRLSGGDTARVDQPSLGLIAGNGINISGAATQVDAYMFSNVFINTCYTASTTCDNTLNVRGFLMSKTLQLRRIGPLN
jgi:hypothetical protein